MKLIRKLSFILITFSFLLSACATGENLEYPVFTIELGRNSSEYIFLKDLFEAKEWVVLDTCKDCIISSIDKIECADNDIYILDKKGNTKIQLAYMEKGMANILMYMTLP